MTAQPPLPPQASPPGGPGVAAFFDRIRGYGAVRPDDGRWFAGVASGLARRWGVDPLLVRGGFVLLTVFGGIGLLLYGLGWLFLPHPDGRIHAQEVLRGVVTPGFVGAVLFVLLDLGGSGWSRGGWVGPHPFGGLLFIALVALGVWWFAIGRHRRRWSGGPGGPGTWGGSPRGPHWGGPGGPGGHGGPGWGGGWGGPGTPGEPGAPRGSAGTGGDWRGTTPPAPSGNPPYDTTPPPPGASGQEGGRLGDPDGHAGSGDIPPYGTPPPRSFSPAGYPGADYLADPSRPGSGAGAPAAVLTAPPVPARWASRPDVQRPSHALTNATLGVALLGAAVVVAANVIWGLPEPGGFVAAGVALGVVALGIVAAGVSGRRAGGLVPIGILLAVVTLAGASAAGRMTWAGDHTWTPVVAQGTTSYTLGVGNGRLDLRQVSAPGATATNPAEIDARIGLGNLTVIVPSGVGVRIVGTTGAGNIDNAAHLTPSPVGSAVPPLNSSAVPGPSGSAVPAPETRHGPSESVDVQTSADPVIVVRANVGVGNLTIDGPSA